MERTLLERIVVPIDGTELSKKILEPVKRIIDVHDTEIVLVSVVPLRGNPPAPDNEAAASARAEHERLAAALGERGLRARGEVLAGDPATEIVELAARQRASLIALATHGRSGVARLIRGSTAEMILRSTRTPVLLANPKAVEAAPSRSHRILVPIDGSERTGLVLPLVREIASHEGAEVVVQYVLELPEAFTPTHAPTVLAAKQAEARAIVEPFRKQLGDLRSRGEIDRGSPVAAILDRAEREKADLVVLATHGRSGAARWALGSVAEEVVRHGRCPVLVVRAMSPAESERLRKVDVPDEGS